MAEQAEMTVALLLSDKLHVIGFQIGSHTIHGQLHSQPTPTSLGQRCVCV